MTYINDIDRIIRISWILIISIIIIVMIIILYYLSNQNTNVIIYKEGCFEKLLLEPTKFDRLINHNFSIVREQFQDNITQEYRFMLSNDSLRVYKIVCVKEEYKFITLNNQTYHISQIDEMWLNSNIICLERENNNIKSRCIRWGIDEYKIYLK